MINPIAIIASTVRISVPYANGALGGTISERGGVVNIALEGIMLSAAFAYATTSWWVASKYGPQFASATAWAPWLGLIVAVLTALLLSMLHAVACVVFRVDNIISGLAINILALGGTNFLLKRIFGSASNSERCPTFTTWRAFPSENWFAPLNQLLHPLIAITILTFVGAWFLLYRTRYGLRLRAVGENPAAADALGVNVSFYRFTGVLIGGIAASLGGVWLAADQGLFSSNMTNGRGYTALAAMIVGKWSPLGAAVACLIFGGAETLQNQLQILRQGGSAASTWLGAVAGHIPTQAIQALPYLLTIVVIAGFIGRATPPAADGVPYEKESE
ncbi:MAG: ABC transporter permease [Candidatus Sumerlaeaceae bacterium]|jgi:simple sugar transport system permease protein